MKIATSSLHNLLFIIFLLYVVTSGVAGGQWELLQSSTGVSAMHMQLLHTDHVVIFDRTDFGPSNLSLPSGHCRTDPADLALTTDCTAHSLLYHPPSNSLRPLTVLTDTWCSSAAVAPDGRLIQTGGFNDGDRTVRTFTPCLDRTCDWMESPNALAVRRWYATNQILPDGRSIIVGGRRQFNYEFYPSSATKTIAFPFLSQTKDVEENNLYPFVHLNVDGNLFVFANNRGVLLDYTTNSIVRVYPKMPGGDPRNYPSSGSSVLLPLKAGAMEAEVLVCGGTPSGSFLKASSKNRVFVDALNSCGRIKITDQSPMWVMETMPMPRVMGDMVLLPNEEVLIINGAASGAAGWENGRDPVVSPVVYFPENPVGFRFNVMNPTTIPRLYHSTALLLRDGRVLVGGSNPHMYYNFTGVDFPTDLSLEAFSPDYLDSANLNSRPKIISSGETLQLGYGKPFSLWFSVAATNDRDVSVTMVAPSFATHSFSMNQRLLVLESGKAASTEGSPSYEVTAVAPASGVLAPAGYYMVFVVSGGIPSVGIWAHIQ